jgi:hypothetical protein
MAGVPRGIIHFMNESLAGVMGYIHLDPVRVHQLLTGDREAVYIYLYDTGSQTNDVSYFKVEKDGEGKLKVTILAYRYVGRVCVCVCVCGCLCV